MLPTMMAARWVAHSLPVLLPLLTLVLPLVLGVGLPFAAAQAQMPYGCACLHNNTQSPVSFRYHWGKNEWKSETLRPNYQEALCWRYAQGSTSSPELTFQIDVDLSNGKAWTTYDLPRVQSARNSCEVVGKHYHYDIGYKANTNKQYLIMTRRPE
jgi:hypothetical protein